MLTAAPAGAAVSPAEQVVRTYSPIVMLRAQEDPPCDTAEEQYEPTTVNTVLGNPRVNLTRPRRERASRRSVVRRRPPPTSRGSAPVWHLDLPGDPLNAGVHLRQGLRGAEGGRARPRRSPTRTSPRERGHSGFVVQYWFFYYFNQFNDLHEGDWEGMQIAFDASTPREALASRAVRDRALPARRRREGGLGRRQGRRRRGRIRSSIPPAGSHATFFDSAVYVENGQGGSGLGCDNTTEPLRRRRPPDRS